MDTVVAIPDATVKAPGGPPTPEHQAPVAANPQAAGLRRTSRGTLLLSSSAWVPPYVEAEGQLMPSRAAPCGHSAHIASRLAAERTHRKGCCGRRSGGASDLAVQGSKD